MNGRSVVVVLSALMVLFAVLIPLSVAIPFVYADLRFGVVLVAYVISSFLLWLLLVLSNNRRAISHGWFEKAIVFLGVLGGPVILAFVITLLFPLVSKEFASRERAEIVEFVSDETYGRTFRRLRKINFCRDQTDCSSFVVGDDLFNSLKVQEGMNLRLSGRAWRLGFIVDKIEVVPEN